VYLDVSDIEENLAPCRKARFDEILQHLVLCIHHDRLAASQSLKINAMASERKLQFDTMMHETLLHHSFADAGLIQQIDGTLLKHAGADTFFDIVSAVCFEDDGLDAF